MLAWLINLEKYGKVYQIALSNMMLLGKNGMIMKLLR